MSGLGAAPDVGLPGTNHEYIATCLASDALRSDESGKGVDSPSFRPLLTCRCQGWAPLQTWGSRGLIMNTLPPAWLQTPSLQDEIERICMRNLLASSEERIFFKDRESRFLFVSAGWLSAYRHGHSLEEVIGKTDFDIFSKAHATEEIDDEQRRRAPRGHLRP